MKFRQEVIDELQRLADLALKHARDGHPEWAKNALRQMNEMLTRGLIDPRSP
jgi:hypothetical protein